MLLWRQSYEKERAGDNLRFQRIARTMRPLKRGVSRREKMNTNSTETIISKFHKLLDEADNEREVQLFLEQHPFLLTLGYRPEGNYVISQLPLGADFRADFAFVISLNSGTFVHLVEIESPTLNIFTSAGDFSAAYNHAFQQIQDWTQWCQSNRDYLFNTISDALGERPFWEVPIPQFRLIAGRRSELKERKRKERFVAKANSLNRNIGLSTYEDLIDSCSLAVYGCLEYVKTDIKCVAYRAQGLKTK